MFNKPNFIYSLLWNCLFLSEKYYPDRRRDEGPSVMSIIREHLEKMAATMMHNVTTKHVLDVTSKDKERFDEFYNGFLSTVHDLEQFLGAYLNAIFARKMKTQEALQMMTKWVRYWWINAKET